MLENAAKRTAEKQPDEIHLIPAPEYRWSDSATVNGFATQLSTLGFCDAATFAIDPLGVFNKDSHLDILFITAPAIDRIERVCAAFYVKQSRLQ